MFNEEADSNPTVLPAPKVMLLFAVPLLLRATEKVAVFVKGSVN